MNISFVYNIYIYTTIDVCIYRYTIFIFLIKDFQSSGFLSSTCIAIILFAGDHFCEDIIIHKQDSALDDDDVLNGPAVNVHWHSIYLSDHIHSFQNLAKDDMFVIQMCCIFMGSHLDKELGFVGVFTLK